MEEFDISSEEYREVVYLLNGSVYRIENPMTLRHQKGGAEHHVTDAQGLTHIYPAPGATCLTAVRWKLREEKS